MSMIVDIAPDSGFLRVHVAGDFSLAEANDAIVRIFKALAEHALQKVLIDCRQLKGAPTTMERFMHGEFVSKEMDRVSGAGVSRGTRFVYVGKEPLVDRRRFAETVAVNRGINVTVTETVEEALRWLEVDPGNKANGTDQK